MANKRSGRPTPSAGRVTPKSPASSNPSTRRTNWKAIAIAVLIISGLLAGFVGMMVGAATSF